MYCVTVFAIALPSMEMILADPGFLTGLAGKGRAVTYIRGNCPSAAMV
jgi:hypothetical protein